MDRSSRNAFFETFRRYVGKDAFNGLGTQNVPFHINSCLKHITPQPPEIKALLSRALATFSLTHENLTSLNLTFTLQGVNPLAW